MQKTEFLNKVLKYYQSTFDIEMDKSYAGMNFLAYGHYYMKAEKYFVTQGTKLYGYSGYEYLFFLDYEGQNCPDFDEVESLIREHVEPELVRKNQRYPHAEHMYSYITIVILHDKPLAEDFLHRAGRFSFNRSYLFSIRGYVNTRIVCVDAMNETVVSNRSGKDIKKLYSKILDGKKVRR